MPSSQFGFRKGLCTSDALVCIMHDMQVAFDVGYEYRVISLDFSSAFDRVNYKVLLSKAESLGTGGHFHKILSEFLTDRRQRVTVDGCFSSFSPVISGVRKEVTWDPSIFIIYIFDMWCAIESYSCLC